MLSARTWELVVRIGTAMAHRTGPPGVDRREALRRLALTGTALAGAASTAWLRWDDGARDPTEQRAQGEVRDCTAHRGSDGPLLAVAKSSRDAAVLARRAVDALGGMRRFVSPGDVVAIKPNIGWDRLPVQAANTNPLVVQELVRLALDAGAKRVVVTDVSCNDPNRCFQRSGIWSAAYSAGATVILPSPHRFREVRIRGELLREWPVFTPLIEADKVINVPVAKHHNLAKYTGALKNWYGILGGRRNRLHQNIDVSIAALATFVRPTLTVVDATRVLVRNGPQGGNLDDVRDLNQVIASLDQVAADACAATLLHLDPTTVGYLRMAEARGLGRLHLPVIRCVEV